MPLSEEEKKELEALDNPSVTFLTPAMGPLVSYLLNMGKRKERVAELRTRMKMDELGLDINTDWQRYYEIKGEEERRFENV